MAFKIATERRFSAPVQVRSDDFTAHYRVLPDETIAGFDFNTAEGQRDFLRASIADLEDVLGEGDVPLAFGVDLLEQLLGFSDVRLALMRSYNRGYFEAKAGN